MLTPIENPQVYIDDDNWVSQKKYDGERRVIISDDNIRGLNRKGQVIHSLPESIIKSINFACTLTLDGEAIGDKYHCFDILSLNGKSLKELSCVERIKILNELNFGAGIEIVKTAYTKTEKQKMFDELKLNNAEGIVFKRKDSVYKVGRHGTQCKFKFQKSGTFIVKNITPGKRSVGMEVLDGEKRIFVGKVSVPVNHELPSVGSFIEVQYLYGYKSGCLFQPVYLRNRSHECELSDCIIEQIIYKAE